MDTDYYNKPIAVVDASSMFRKLIAKNMRPYTVKVIKLNNRMVDDWEKVILRPMSTKGKVPAGNVWSSWKLYYEGKGLHEYAKIREQCPRANKKQLKFWINFFEELTIDELHAYGVGVISFGWSVVENEIRFWSADEKWDKVFQYSDNPQEWEKLSFENKDLIGGKVLPFWDEKIRSDITEKVGSILGLQVTPEYFRQRITPNMKPYTKEVTRLNNSMIDVWELLTGGKTTKRLSISRIDDWMLWDLWYEGKGIQRYVEIRDMIPRPSKKQLKFWIRLLDESTIEELHSYGMGIVSFAQKLIQSEIRMHIASQKWVKIFRHGGGIKGWAKLAGENQDLIKGKYLPFWNEEILKNVSEKVGTILALPIIASN